MYLKRMDIFRPQMQQNLFRLVLPYCSLMLTLQSPKSPIVCLLIFKVNQDSLRDVILWTSQGVSFTEVQEGLIVGRGLSA